MDIKAGSVWSRAAKLAVRRMYLTQGLSPSEIAKKLDRSPQDISNILYRQGWSKLRREQELAVHESAEQEASDYARSFADSVAVNTQELAEKAFALSHATDDAKDLMQLSIMAKNHVGMARQAMNLDAANALTLAGPQLSAICTRPMLNVTNSAPQTQPDSDELDFA